MTWFVFLYAYADEESLTDIQTYRQADRLRDRLTDRKISKRAENLVDKQADRQTDRQTYEDKENRQKNICRQRFRQTITHLCAQDVIAEC